MHTYLSLAIIITSLQENLSAHSFHFTEDVFSSLVEFGPKPLFIFL